MIRISSHELNKLSSELQSIPDFIIIGEMHGSKQNAHLMQELLSAILVEPRPITVAFEWVLSDLECDALRTYIHGGEIPMQLPIFFLDSDGRFTYEHAELLKWIRVYNIAHNNLIDLYSFDESTGSENSDLSMAGSLRIYKKGHPESLILVETGNMHARSTSYVSRGTEYLPLSALLKIDYVVFSIFLQYLRGEISVEGKKRDVTKATSQQEGSRSFFDVVIEIPISEPTQNPDALTKISKIL